MWRNLSKERTAVETQIATGRMYRSKKTDQCLQHRQMKHWDRRRTPLPNIGWCELLWSQQRVESGCICWACCRISQMRKSASQRIWCWMPFHKTRDRRFA